ncbi:hypothetical protein R6Q59_033900 [Mikania micrantha]
MDTTSSPPSPSKTRFTSLDDDDDQDDPDMSKAWIVILDPYLSVLFEIWNADHCADKYMEQKRSLLIRNKTRNDRSTAVMKTHNDEIEMKREDEIEIGRT